MLALFELLRARRHDFAGNVAWSGLAHLRAALDQRRGVYLACSGDGNLEALSAAVSRCVAPTHLVAPSTPSRFLRKQREIAGVLALPPDPATLDAAVARGEIVAFSMAQAEALVEAERRLPAPVVQARVTRRALGRHAVEFLSPAEPRSTRPA